MLFDFVFNIVFLSKKIYDLYIIFLFLKFEIEIENKNIFLILLSNNLKKKILIL